jgi:hypothetical protein
MSWAAEMAARALTRAIFWKSILAIDFEMTETKMQMQMHDGYLSSRYLAIDISSDVLVVGNSPSYTWASRIAP